MSVEFPEHVVLAAFRRSLGFCECTTLGCGGGHATRCHKQFTFAQRATSDRKGWQAHHKKQVQHGGQGTYENCEILCNDCHVSRHLSE